MRGLPAVQVNDISMYYELHGTGTPVVLIGGLGADLSLLTPITRELARHRQVLVFDNRGAGRADQPDSPYSIEMMARDTVALMDALSIEQADILGVSIPLRARISRQKLGMYQQLRRIVEHNARAGAILPVVVCAAGNVRRRQERFMSFPATVPGS